MFKISKVYYVLSLCCFLVSVSATATFQGQNLDRKIGARFRSGNPAPSVSLHVIGAPWCQPCQKMVPILEKLKKQGYSITHVDVKSHTGPIPELTYSQFGEVVKVEIGLQTEAQIKATFQEIEGSVF